jgi:hypothetical protein
VGVRERKCVRFAVCAITPLCLVGGGTGQPKLCCFAMSVQWDMWFNMLVTLRGLRHAREVLLQPWSTDVTPPKARVSGPTVASMHVSSVAFCAAPPMRVENRLLCSTTRAVLLFCYDRACAAITHDGHLWQFLFCLLRGLWCAGWGA